MKNLLAAVMLVALAAVALSQNPNVPDNVPKVLKNVPKEFLVGPPRQKWEYKVTDRGGFNAEAWEKRLNDMAKDGWELDQIDQGEGDYIFKRTPGPRPAAVAR